jgi:hypothetical protein
MAINTGSWCADTTGVKPTLGKDLLFGGTAGTAVVATLALTVTTMGPLLGIEWPGDRFTGDRTERVSLPAATEERARPPRLPAPDAPRVRVSLERRASDDAARPRRRGAAADRDTEPASRRVDVPATSLPPARGDEGEPAPATPGSTAPAAAAATAPVTTAPARKGVNLRVASISVVTDEEEAAPELRVGLAITNGTATAGVPEQVTLHLRPELPEDVEPSGSALALRAHIDVVDGAGRNAAGASASPLQMRVRMAFATADGAEPTVADRGDGDGQSNVLDVKVPLSALAPEGPPTGENPGPTDPAPTDPPAGEPPATPPPAADPALEIEIRLDLVPPTSPDDEVGETTDVPVPADPTQFEPPAESVPVTVVVDSGAPAAAEAPAATTADAATTPDATTPAPGAAETETQP